MSNPRYVPSEFAVHPDLFGKEEVLEWRTPDETWSLQQRAQLNASMLQHRVVYWLLHFESGGRARKVTAVARATKFRYERLLAITNGSAVIQMQDIGQLRVWMGSGIDLWLLDGPNLPMAKAMIDAR